MIVTNLSVGLLTFLLPGARPARSKIQHRSSSGARAMNGEERGWSVWAMQSHCTRLLAVHVLAWAMFTADELSLCALAVAGQVADSSSSSSNFL